jgi:hypothetical protein
MVSGEQNLRHSPTAEGFRPRVVRIVEESGRKRILNGAPGISEDAWNKANDRVREDQRGKRAICEDIVADGDFLVDEMIPHTLVHAFIVTANEDQMVFL